MQSHKIILLDLIPLHNYFDHAQFGVFGLLERRIKN